MSLVVELRVKPGSPKQFFTLDKAGRLTCYLKEKPEKGLANKELIKLLAKTLGVIQADVAIIAGETSRIKLVRIPLAITLDDLLVRLGIALQMTM